MGHAVQCGLIDCNPGAEATWRGADAAARVTHRPARRLELPELTRLDYYNGRGVNQTGRLQFTLLTFSRSSEIRLARWSELIQNAPYGRFRHSERQSSPV